VDELIAGMAGVASTLGLFWVYYVLRERRRQQGGNPRLQQFSADGSARLPVEYEDRPGNNLPTKATSLNDSFTLRIENRGIVADSQLPGLLGDASTFWRSLLADLQGDTLPHVDIDGDVYVLAKLSFPPKGRVLLRLLSSDFDILREVKSVDGPRT
jgi:hypothetical protein